MFSCYYDPGMALFLAEVPTEDGAHADPLEWVALFAIVLLCLMPLAMLLGRQSLI